MIGLSVDTLHGVVAGDSHHFSQKGQFEYDSEPSDRRGWGLLFQGSRVETALL